MSRMLGYLGLCWALAFSMAALTGCMAMDEAGMPFDTPNTCETDSDCYTHGGRCDFELGACVSADGAASEEVVLYIFDPTLGVPTEHQYELSSEIDGALNINLDEPVLVRGIVSDERADGAPIAARLTFRRQSSFSGASMEPVFVDASAEITRADDGFEHNYQTRLTPGDYEVDVEPTATGSDSPDVTWRMVRYPLRVQRTIDSSGGTDVQHFVVSSETRTISSTVVDAAGTPMGNVRVYALDSATKRRVSGVAVTQCEGDPATDETCGLFELTVPSTVESIKVHFSGAESSSLLPIVETSAFTLSEAVEDLGDVAFPALETPILYTNSVVGVGRDGSQVPLAGAAIEFRTHEDTGFRAADGRFELSARTDAEGNIVAEDEGLTGAGGVGIWLRPGVYDLTIIPTTDGELANGRVSITVEPPDDGEDEPPLEPLRVGSRALLTGVVFSPESIPLPQVNVEVTNENGTKFSTATDDQGYFSLYVDRGLYDVLCIPPEASHLSWTRLADVGVYQDEYVDFEVGLGTPVTGAIIRRETDEPISSALIEGYVVRDVLDGPAELLPIARIRTSANGSFTFLVPEADALIH